MNIQVRACVQGVNHQHAHMISDGHTSIDDVPVKVKKMFASSLFTGPRCHESLFHTCFAV